jgi:hypothetical protein
LSKRCFVAVLLVPEEFQIPTRKKEAQEAFDAQINKSDYSSQVLKCGSIILITHAPIFYIGGMKLLEHPAFFRCWRHSKGIRDRLRHRETKIRWCIKTITRLDI